MSDLRRNGPRVRGSDELEFEVRVEALLEADESLPSCALIVAVDVYPIEGSQIGEIQALAELSSGHCFAVAFPACPANGDTLH